MNYDSYTRLAMTDNGTRYAHYCELLALWETGLEVINDLGYQTKENKKKHKELVAGTALLRRQSDVMCGYEEGGCSNALYPLKRTINQLPAADQIRGGRGGT